MGLIQAAAPLGFWWLDPATVYALSLALTAAVYIGFAVADGRPRIVATDPGEEQSVNAALADRERRDGDEHQADDECDEPAAAPAPGEGGIGPAAGAPDVR